MFKWRSTSSAESEGRPSATLLLEDFRFGRVADFATWWKDLTVARDFTDPLEQWRGLSAADVRDVYLQEESQLSNFLYAAAHWLSSRTEREITLFLVDFLIILIPCLLPDKDVDDSLFWQPYQYYDERTLPALAPFILKSIIQRLKDSAPPNEIQIWPEDQPAKVKADLKIEDLRLRTRLLTLLLSCMSEGLFVTFEDYPNETLKWLNYFCQETIETKRPFFTALTGTVICHRINQGGLLNRNAALARAQNDYFRASVHVWLALVTYGFDKLSPDEQFALNEFWVLLREVDPQRMPSVTKQLCSLLEGCLAAQRNKQAHGLFAEQVLCVLRSLMCLRTPLLNSVGNGFESNRLVAAVLTAISSLILEVDNKAPTAAQPQASLMGPAHATGFVLLDLLSGRSAGLALNEKSLQKAYGIIKVEDDATMADAIVSTLHQVAFCSNARDLVSLIDLLLTVLANVSPLIKSFSLASASKFLGLFQRFYKVSAHADSAPYKTFVVLLMETFDNLIQYQYRGNANLVFEMIRQRVLFEGLLTRDEAQLEGEEKDPSRWLESLPSSLSIGRLLTYVGPKVDNFCQERDVYEPGPIIEYISELVLVGVLPVPHKLFLRSYQHTAYLGLWFLTYVWGLAVTCQAGVFETSSIALLSFVTLEKNTNYKTAL